MKRSLAGAVAVGAVGVGSAFLAVPGGAQEPEPPIVEHLDANLTPTVVRAGQTVTVTSVDPCPQPPEVEEPTADVLWAFGPTGWLDPDDPSVVLGEIVGEGTAPVAEDGTWEVTFTAPGTSGAYELFAACRPAGAAPAEDLGDVVEETTENATEEAATLGDEHDDDGEHGGSSSTTSPPSTEPPSTEPTMPELEEVVFLYGPEAFTVQGAPAPATAVPGEPGFTG